MVQQILQVPIEGVKQCSVCLLPKPADKFVICGRNGVKVYKYSYCRKCYNKSRKKFNKKYYEQNKVRILTRNKKYSKENYDKILAAPSNRYSRAKAMAKKRNRCFSLTIEEYMDQLRKPCFYCGSDLQAERCGVGLDRIDNSRGYELNNVLPCCRVCNMIRGAHMTVDEAKLVIQYWKTIRGGKPNAAVS